MTREEICDLRLLILAEQDLYNKNSKKFTDGYRLMLERTVAYAVNGCNEEAVTALQCLQNMRNKFEGSDCNG